jgi:hypothetical protein
VALLSRADQTPSKLELVQKGILKQIGLIVDAVLISYGMEDQIRNERDLKREILINLATNLVLVDTLYFLVYNLACMSLEDKLLPLKSIMGDKAILENFVSLQ